MPQSKITYDTPFKEYPDVVNVSQMCEMLGGISLKMGYRLLKNNEIEHLRVGRSYRIPKLNVIKYLRII